MTIYILAYVAMLILALYSKKHNISKSIFFIVIFVMWAAIIGLRHPSMGHDLRYGDSNGYWGMYRVIGKSSWSDVLNKEYLNYETGYAIFNKLLYTISENAQFLLIVSAIIAMGAVMWLICKYSKSPLLSVIIYLSLPAFLINFSGIRQSIAVAITMYSFRFIKEKKLIPFIVLVIIANRFHSSAIVFLAAYPIYHLKTHKDILKVGSVLLFPIVYVFRVPLFNIMARLLGENDTATATNAIMLFLFFALIYFFCLLFEDKENKEQIGYRNLFYVACIFQAFSGVSNLAMRVGYYFMIYLALLFPEIIISQDKQILNLEKENIKVKPHSNSTIMYTAVFIFFLCWGIYSISTATWAETNPHSFFWQ